MCPQLLRASVLPSIALMDIVSRNKLRCRMPEIVAPWFQARCPWASCKLLDQLRRSVRGNLVLTLDKGEGTSPNRMRTAVLHQREVNPIRGAICVLLLALAPLE